MGADLTAQPMPDTAWDAPVRRAAEDEPALVVDLEGFEGPLDLLLALARSQKVDLAKLSILALAEQYLAFVGEARRLRLELAADYLVMAAWLAYLKSRLLLPDPPDDDEMPSAEELAEVLAHRLRRLDAMRVAAARLIERPRLGRDVFLRGALEQTAGAPRVEYQATLYDLVSAYADERQRHMRLHVEVKRRAVWSLADARAALERVLGAAADWMPIETAFAWLPGEGSAPAARASVFSAGLELVREGRLELRQSSAFAPLYMRGQGPRPS
jgi:segregation and condensation protein A